MDWYLKVMKQYADFEGRARRKEYWMFILFYMIITIAVYMFGGVLVGSNVSGALVIMFLPALIHFLPSLAVQVRRLHDIGKSGWWLLISFIPLIGAIVMFVFLCTDSQPGSNQWGPNPKDPYDDGTMEGVIDDFV